MNPPANENDDRPTQFSLRAVFGITTGAAILFGAIHWFGASMTVTVLVVLLLFIAAANVAVHHKRFATMVGLSLLGLMTIGCLLSMLSERGHLAAARRAQCTNNLKQIGIALHGYVDDYGCLPPAYIADADGRPMHSWRVLILPYIEHKALYDQYDFSEPWDGPHNRSLAAYIPLCFQCPSDAAAQRTAATSYVAVTGPSTIWPDNGATSFNEISDGPASTIAVVEMAQSRIHWMEPSDLPSSALKLGVNPPTGLGLGSEHPGVAQALFCDGSIRALESTISVKTLQALATKSGGETIGEEY